MSQLGLGPSEADLAKYPLFSVKYPLFRGFFKTSIFRHKPNRLKIYMRPRKPNSKARKNFQLEWSIFGEF